MPFPLLVCATGNGAELNDHLERATCLCGYKSVDEPTIRSGEDCHIDPTVRVLAHYACIESASHAHPSATGCVDDIMRSLQLQLRLLLLLRPDSPPSSPPS
jgi:hypothetical protein